MPLIKCPDCGGDVSSSAPNCTDCGKPMAGNAVLTQRKGGQYEALGFLLIVFGIGICFISGVVGSLMIAAGFVVFLGGRFM